MEQSDTVCIHTVGNYSMAGKTKQELFRFFGTGNMDDSRMFNIHSHRT